MHRLAHPAKVDVALFDGQSVFAHTTSPLVIFRLPGALTKNADWHGPI